ncbi:primosomal protein N' [Campylobacter majalis]|uniref:Replication restart protein PriA n=1 Tax=Campylobacter majalis TaxID=2790656 RepID=A0ABN7K258_9BACT|nr:primosomal protein N' [Campylobacter majalis]CAD7286638.1 primosomal protein N' [Campylobacter majalis]
MRYYTVGFVGLNLAPLTYHSDEKLLKFRLVYVSLRGKNTLACVLDECEKPSFKTLEIVQILPFGLTNIQQEIFNFIRYYYLGDIGGTLGLFEFDNDCAALGKDSFINVPNLSQLQQKAYEFLNSHNMALLFGDTGSGKSEIYIKMIADVLNSGKQALFLMPEISLTPQMQTRLEYYFGDAVAVWHSKVTPKRKNEILNGIKSSNIRLIAGARSALFLPLWHLGLIVVDEEHDDSYKNHSRPHYNARDLSLIIGQKCDIKVVLGSATPSLTTYEKLPSFRLKQTFFNTQKTYIFDKSQTGLSKIIKDEISKSLSKNKQIIVCLPTRANYRFLQCKECGETIKCPFCSVGMSYYKKQNVLKCQYCEYKTPVINRCEKCGSQVIQAQKIGTSELIEQLQQTFANARISKFDRDEITTQNKLKKALEEFNDGKIDILVGTQMLSKGHDYHNVDLAVIMGIDEMLNYADFRAREKTLALVKQVSGRAGRKGQGRAIIQTYHDDFFNDYLDNYDEFIKNELVFRAGLYPPYCRMLRILITHKNDAIASKMVMDLVDKISKFKLDFEIIGYGKCAIELMANKFRYEILIRSSSHRPLIQIAKISQNEFVDCDIDPINFS